MRLIGALVFAGALLCAAPPAAEAQDLAQVKAELVAKMANLRDREIQLNNAAQALQRKEAQLVQTVSALDARAAQLKPRMDQSTAEIVRYNQAVAQHNSGCAGTFSDQGHVNRCNQKKADLDAWKAGASARAQQIENERVTIVNTYNKLQTDASKLENDQKANAAALQKTRAGIAVIQAALNKLSVDDGFLRDPRARQQISSTCAKMANLEQSVECMKRVFDGAQSR